MKINKSDFLKKLSFLKQHNKKVATELLDIAEVVEKEKGFTLSKQFEQSHSFYFLVEGQVNFAIALENSAELFSVGNSSEILTPVGWSGFRAPNRYATTVTCSEKSVLVKWLHSDLEKYFKKNPKLGCGFLNFVFKKSLILLNQIRSQIAENSKNDPNINLGKDSDYEEDSQIVSSHEPLDLLRQSPFFEIFPEKILKKLSRIAQSRSYLNGDRIFTQGEKSDGIDLLANGNVVRFFSPDAVGKPLDENCSESVALRSINYPGYVIGWAGADKELTCDTTAVATRNSVVYHFNREDVDKVLNESPKYTLMFAKRLLWLISNLLRNNRARMISEQFELEIVAVNSIIEQNSTQLSVDSQLHKLPFLLDNVVTLEDAFDLLFDIENSGNRFEKSLSRACLDILGRVYKEHRFYVGLQNTYKAVASAPGSKKPGELRQLAAEKFIEVFKDIPYVLTGLENLPEEGGNIFIFNHFVNHPYNTLPNNFQITLDSHFVSSIILYKKYGDSGIRVVRLPRADEYGHQNYYGRLGHINVFTNESDIMEESAEELKAQKKKFYRTAASHLKRGTNLIINPEGTSYKTEDSPGEFKGGAFLLASSIDPEPVIVPIALANFDKRVNRNVFVAIIKKPFRISDFVEKPNENKKSLFEFLAEYRKTYRNYVEEAVEIANKSAKSSINLKHFEKVTNN